MLLETSFLKTALALIGDTVKDTVKVTVASAQRNGLLAGCGK